MATTFVKVIGVEKVRELWEAGLLWRQIGDHSPWHIPYTKGVTLWHLQHASDGYMVEN